MNLPKKKMIAEPAISKAKEELVMQIKRFSFMSNEQVALEAEVTVEEVERIWLKNRKKTWADDE